MSTLSKAPFVEQETRRKASLITPVTFSIDLGAGATTIYTGLTGKFFLIREMSVCNTTTGALGLTVTEEANTWVNAHSVAANTTENIAGLSGILIIDGEDLAGLGSALGLTVFGWGLQIEGGDSWIL
jgi:hypothetical protein